MYYIEIGGKPDGTQRLKFSYIIGAFTVGIITPSRKKHVFKITEVSGRLENPRLGGNSDSRLTPDELAAFVIKHKLT